MSLPISRSSSTPPSPSSRTTSRAYATSPSMVRARSKETLELRTIRLQGLAGVIVQSIKVLLQSRLNILLLMGFPLLMGSYNGWSDGLQFWLSLIVLVPLAERLSFVTEQLAAHTSSTIGGLLNATFGNLTELIVCYFALKDGLLRVVQLSLLGSVLSNLLLVLGMSFIVGGLRHKVQKFKEAVGHVNSGLLLLASSALVVPTLLIKTGKDNDQTDDLTASRLISVLLFINYCLYLLFQLRTHVTLFEDESDHDNDGPVELGPRAAAAWLAIITVAVSTVSSELVEAIKGTAEEHSMSSVFICAIVIPLAGNAAEHGAAVIFAYRNKMDIVMGICLGSATQVALLVLPACVLMGWTMEQPMTLIFETFEVFTLILTIITVTFMLIASNGESNWLVGVILVSTYVVFAVGFWTHKNESLNATHFELSTNLTELML
eukprot:m.155028 g.155028  ORF g.155028 m.155028 type:complete len:434 (+) comp30921_c0_seq1:190-1491(+)